MMHLKELVFSLAFAGMISAVSAQLNSYPESYKIDQKDVDRARRIILFAPRLALSGTDASLRI